MDGSARVIAASTAMSAMGLLLIGGGTAGRCRVVDVAGDVCGTGSSSASVGREYVQSPGSAGSPRAFATSKGSHMRAALITGRHTLELREFPDPVPAAGAVVVDIT